MTRFITKSAVCLFLLASLNVCWPATERSLEELAKLFARYPEGTGFRLSPKGDRFLANMPKDGKMGVMVFDVSDPAAGLEVGVYLAPDSKYEIQSPRWVDNDNVGYSIGAFDSYLTGYNIDRIIPGKRTFKRFTDSPWSGNYERGYFHYLSQTMPEYEGLFRVSESYDQKERRFHFNAILMELTKYQKADEIRRWTNPGVFDYWIFKGTEPYAVGIDEGQFTLDFDRLASSSYEEAKAALEDLKPLDLPGELNFFTGDVAVLSIDSDEGDKKGLALYDVAKGKFLTKPLFAEGYSMIDETTGFLDVRSGGDLVGIISHTDRPECHYFDPGIAGIMNQLEGMIPDGIPVFEGLSGDNRFMYYEIRSDTKDSVYMRLDFQTGNSERLYAVRPWISELELTPRNPVSFKNREGQTIHGYLILPKGFKEGDPVPLVAFSHGGPWVRDFWGFDEEAQFYASLGYAVLQVNYRGSVGFGEKYGLDGDILDISEASPKDVIDGVRWAISEGIADPEKIAFSGGSYGAFISLSCAALEPDLPACAIGMAGAYDLTLLRDADAENEMPWVDKIYEDFEENEERYKELSPTTYAANVKAPILLIHGGKDARVGYRQVNAMADALKDSNADVEVVKRRFLLHGFPNEEYKFEYYVLVGEFLQKHLGK